MTILPANLWAWLPQISESELKVWLYLLAHLPPGATGAGIPLRAIEQGTGLARSSVMRGQAGLRAKGIVQGEDRSGSATRYGWPPSTPIPANGGAHPAQITPTAPVLFAEGGSKLRPLRGSTLGTRQAGNVAGEGVGARATQFDPAESNRIVSDQTFKKLPDSIPGAGDAKTDQPATATAEGLNVSPSVGSTSAPPATPVAGTPAEQMARLTAQLHPGAAPAARRANTTRLLRLYGHSGLAATDFAACMDTAAARTQSRLSKPAGRPLACPISYFFTVLERLLTEPVPVGMRPGAVAAVAISADAATGPELPMILSSAGGDMVAAEPAPVTAAAALPPRDLPPALPMPGGESARLWQAALVYLRASVPADAYGRVVRYAVALDLRRGQEVAVIGVPAEYMRAELSGALAPALAWALGQVCGRALRVQVAVLTGRGGLAA